MELKGRLKLIADKVGKCNVLCDVGTDHCYIPIYALNNNKCNKAIAIDVKEGPILAANANILKYKKEKFIETRLGNGLTPIKENECDTIVIAGMGGLLMSEILNQDYEKLKKKTNTLILQPMNATEVVREWLYEKGFDIFDEELVAEGEKIYTVICAKWTNELRKVNLIYYYIGEKLIQKKDPLLKDLIKKKIKLFKKITDEMKNSKNKNAKEEIEKYTMIVKELQLLLN